jgi:putative addiction module killer protein
MLTFITSSVFADWLDGLSDNIAKANILNRLARAKLGNFGDCEPVGEGVFEMRIHSGAGYRVYYVRTGSVVYVLLCGGNKATQKRDIATAKKLARDFKKEAP